MNDLMEQGEQLKEIAEQIKTLHNHGFVQSRLILLDAYHEIGELILGLPSKYSAVKDLARLTEISERTLYNCAKFYEKYPSMDKLPEGNNISWNKIVTHYLTEIKSDIEHVHTPITICSSCKKRI